MSVVSSKFRSRWAVAVLAPVLAVGGLTLVSAPSEAVICVVVVPTGPSANAEIHASATVPQGGEFDLRARGLTLCNYADIYLGARHRQYVADVFTDGQGKFDGYFYMPAGTPLGNQVITVVDASGASFTTTIRVVRGVGVAGM